MKNSEKIAMRETHSNSPRITPRILNNLAAVSLGLASIPSANAPEASPVPSPHPLSTNPPSPPLVKVAPSREQLPDWVNEVTSGRQKTNLANASLPPMGIFAVTGTHTLAEVRGSQARAHGSFEWDSLSMPSFADPEIGKQRSALQRLKEVEHDGLIHPGLVRLVESLMLKTPGQNLLDSYGSGGAGSAHSQPLPKNTPEWLIRRITAGEVETLVSTIRHFREDQAGPQFDKATIQSVVSLGFLAGGERGQGGIAGVKDFLSGLEQNKVRTISDIAAHYLSTAGIGVARLTEHGGIDLSHVIPPSGRQAILGTPGNWRRKLGSGQLVGSDPGYCVTAVLETMEANWVPNPAATGKDSMNNPRGLASQLINHFGWRPLEIDGFGKIHRLKSPVYGDFNAKVMSAQEFSRAVDLGKIPDGAIVFQTRHPSWNGNSVNSLGFDASIALNRGVSLWNGSWNGRRIYGEATRWVFVLVPGDVDGE